MSATLLIALGLGVLAVLLIGLGWRIGRLGERVRNQHREHHRKRDDEGLNRPSRSHQVVILIGKRVKMTNRK